MLQAPLATEPASLLAAVFCAAAAEDPSPDPDAQKALATILVVDNDPVLRMLLVKFLTFAGYAAFEARLGTEALKFAKRHPAPIDLLITDVMMPGMNGFDLAREFLELHPEIKVLYMSGHVYDVPDVGKAAHASPESFLVKPFWAEQLLERVQRILSGPAPSGQTS